MQKIFCSYPKSAIVLKIKVSPLQSLRNSLYDSSSEFYEMLNIRVRNPSISSPNLKVPSYTKWRMKMAGTASYKDQS